MFNAVSFLKYKTLLYQNALTYGAPPADALHDVRSIHTHEQAISYIVFLNDAYREGREIDLPDFVRFPHIYRAPWEAYNEWNINEQEV